MLSSLYITYVCNACQHRLDREIARMAGLCAKHNVSSGEAKDFAKCNADNVGAATNNA